MQSNLAILPLQNDDQPSGTRLRRRPLQVGPYLVSHQTIAASVHLAVLANDPRRVLALKRMLRGEAIGAAIRHENVVQTYGCHVVDATNAFLVMDYVAGVSLFDASQQSHGNVSPRMAASIVANVLRGLHAAHGAGIIHRDVCPQNILLGVDGIPRVTDFRAGAIEGKLAYMAPEQLLAQPIDRRADIHAAGVVLWELLASGAIFDTEGDVPTLAQTAGGSNRPPSHHNLEVPRGLDAIALRAMERDPAQRFATALEMADALDALFAHQPVTPREIATWISAIGYEAISDHSALQVELQSHALSRSAATPKVKILAQKTQRSSSSSRPAPPPAPAKRPMIELVAVVMLVIASALAGAAAMRILAQPQSDGMRANVNRTSSGRTSSGRRFALESTVTSMRSSPRT